jgi:hypothetical protein
VYDGPAVGDLGDLAPPASCLAFSPDGKTLTHAGIRKDPGIYLWSLERKGDYLVLKGKLNEKGIAPSETSIAFSPDGELLVVGDNEFGLHFWDPASGELIRHAEANGAVTLNLAFSPDGNVLASSELTLLGAGAERKGQPGVYLREVASGGAIIRKLSGPANCVTFSRDGRTIATAEGKSVKLWDAWTGEALLTLEGHRGEVYSVAFAPDGKSLASGSADTTALLWDVADILTRPRPKAPLQTEPGRLWEELASKNPARAYAAIQELTAAGAAAVKLLAGRVQPAVAPDAAAVKKWLADLGSERFANREKARAALHRLGKAVETALRDRLAKNPAAEERARLEDLLKEIGTRTLNDETLRGIRAVQVLERIGSKEAQSLLVCLAGGAPAPLTQAARAARDRLVVPKRGTADGPGGR